MMEIPEVFVIFGHLVIHLIKTWSLLHLYNRTANEEHSQDGRRKHQHALGVINCRRLPSVCRRRGIGIPQVSRRQFQFLIAHIIPRLDTRMNQHRIDGAFQPACDSYQGPGDHICEYKDVNPRRTDTIGADEGPTTFSTQVVEMDQKTFQSSLDPTNSETKSEHDDKSYESHDEEGSIQKVGLASRWGALAKTLSVETGGIQRVTEEDRQHNATHVWNAGTFW